jgi:hypothetical protein
MRHSSFTRLGKLSTILFKDCRKELAEEAEIVGEETLKKTAQFFQRTVKG